MELGPSMIVGLTFSIIGFILYFIRTNKPNVSRGVTWNVLKSIIFVGFNKKRNWKNLNIVLP